MRKPASLASLACGHFVKYCGQFGIKQRIITVLWQLLYPNIHNLWILLLFDIKLCYCAATICGYYYCLATVCGFYHHVWLMKATSTVKTSVKCDLLKFWNGPNSRCFVDVLSSQNLACGHFLSFLMSDWEHLVQNKLLWC